MTIGANVSWLCLWPRSVSMLGFWMRMRALDCKSKHCHHMWCVLQVVQACRCGCVCEVTQAGGQVLSLSCQQGSADGHCCCYNSPLFGWSYGLGGCWLIRIRLASVCHVPCYLHIAVQIVKCLHCCTLYLLRYQIVYAWLWQELCGITVELSRIPQGSAYKHLGRIEPDCSNRLECESQGVMPLGLQDGRLKGHTKGWLPCIEWEGWWFKKTKLESLGLRTRAYIQVMRALKLLPKVHEP